MDDPVRGAGEEAYRRERPVHAGKVEPRRGDVHADRCRVKHPICIPILAHKRRILGDPGVVNAFTISNPVPTKACESESTDQN